MVPITPIDIRYINIHIKEPPPPKPLDISLRCVNGDRQSRMDARSGKHNIVPVPAHKHQIRSRTWIGLDRVQKDLGEYFYRDLGELGNRGPLIPLQQMMDFVDSGREGRPIQGQAREARLEVGPIEVRIHGE